jgi:hypothetical protein
MKIFLTLTIALGMSGFVMMAGAPAEAAGTHKCKGGTSFGQMTFTFKKGRVRGGGFTLESKVQADGGIQLSYQGETAFLGADGIVRGRGGAKTGKHTCDLASARAALQK